MKPIDAEVLAEAKQWLASMDRTDSHLMAVYLARAIIEASEPPAPSSSTEFAVERKAHAHGCPARAVPPGHSYAGRCICVAEGRGHTLINDSHAHGCPARAVPPGQPYAGRCICVAETGTWVCGHGRTHPLPAPGYSMCCSCDATTPWVGPSQ